MPEICVSPGLAAPRSEGTRGDARLHHPHWLRWKECRGRRVPAPCPSMGAHCCTVLPGSAPSACGAWEGTAPTCTCRELGGSCRRGRRAPVNHTQFITRPEQLSLEIRLYRVSSSELHPRIVFERLAVPPAHLLLQPPQQLPLERAQPCRSPSEGLLGAGAQSGAGTAGTEGGRAQGTRLGPVPKPVECLRVTQ